MTLRSIFLALLLMAPAAYALPPEQEPSQSFYSPGEEEEKVPADHNQDDPNNNPVSPTADPAPYIKEAEEQKPKTDADGNVVAEPAPEAQTPAPTEPPKWVETSGGEVKALNKIYSKNKLIKLKKNQEAAFGAIKIKIEKCFRMPESDKKESSALLLISETFKSQPTKEIFHGWMFSSSPAISALEHPLYDVILLGCEDEEKPKAETSPAKPDPKAKKK